MGWIEEYTSAKKDGREPRAGKRVAVEEPKATPGDVKAPIIDVLADADGLALGSGRCCTTS